MIVGYTKLYSYREKADTSFETTNESFHLFLCMLLLCGCLNLPDRKIYWDTPPDTFVQATSDSTFSDTLGCILRNLHLCETT